jgi:diguanylate cyclase (GGDEF)-like protein
MIFKMLETTVGESKPYEIVVAILLVIISTVALIFLYHNVIKHWRERRLEKEATHQEKGKESKINLFKNKKNRLLDAHNIKDKINNDILNSSEGDLRVLFSIDIDDFRALAEKYDQKQLDKIIREIEKRLEKKSEENHISGHLDKDKFIYYYTGEVTNESVIQIAQDLLNLINEPLKIDDIQMTASVGVCVFPYDGIDADGLLKNAELAVYVAKKEGKAKYNIYSADMIEKERYNITYYEEIKNAIDNEQFMLYYQPIVDVRTGKIIGLESLLRWNHPEMGVLPPSKFLNVMDLTGDITWFGMWGFERVVHKYSEWLREFRIRQLFISINLSPKQLMIEDLASKFYDVTTKYSMKPDNFTLEVLDYYSIDRNEIAMRNLVEFKKYGFRVAIDDHGDAFELIEDMPNVIANMIKIPRRDTIMIIDNDPIAESIKKLIHTAMTNHKVVIAEGIEDPNMIGKMSELNIRFLQGYFFSEPVEVDKAKEMVRRNPWKMDAFEKYL